MVFGLRNSAAAALLRRTPRARGLQRHLKLLGCQVVEGPHVLSAGGLCLWRRVQPAFSPTTGWSPSAVMAHTSHIPKPDSARQAKGLVGVLAALL